ncbi:MAG TPA: fumarylacetoacetate hydrolase family protein [Stellaceae bacterium]|nr:fumarylacetoacetate hydrolase family protein [Stellaceae bacterium]
MKLVSFTRGGTASYGLLLKDGRVMDLPQAAGLAGLASPGADMIAFIAGGSAASQTARRLEDDAGNAKLAPAISAASAVKLTAPIPRPAKNVFCIGRNYKEHVAEGYRARAQEIKMPEAPQIFTKPPTAVIGPDDEFRIDPAVSSVIDYEVELGVIIGQGGTNISPAKAMDHIFGYTIINDVTARDLQRKHDQWFKGKGLDRSCPMGPYILTKDEVKDVGALELTLTVNGEQRQKSTVNMMIFDIPAIIQNLSSGMTLEAGDVIATGTPSGVGFAMNPPGLLKAGDVTVCKITQLGELATRFVAAK